MTTQLGRGRLSEPETLVGLLLACHERIRSFAALGARVSEPGHTPEELRDACERVGRYFGEALPLHVRDEEESVLPRLREGAPALGASLSRMAREHREHEADVAALIDACGRAVPTLEPAALAEVAACSQRLVAAFAEHLAAEEAEIFPRVAALPEAEQAEIVAELRARRRR